MPARASISIEWIPQPEIIAQAYFMVAGQAQQLGEPLMASTEIVAQEIEANFAAEGRPEAWAPLSEATVLTRGSDGPILTLTGALRAAVTSPSAWSQSGGGSDVEAVLTDPTGYGGYHVEGTSRMPARDYTYVSDDALQGIDELFLNWIAEPW